MSSSESLIAKISKSITRWDSFKFERKHIGELLYNEFSPLSDSERLLLLSTTSEWAMNLLRQRLDKSRFIAFLVISFVIEIDEDSTHLNQLSIDLEKLLPLESITLLEGIAFLFKRIAELQTVSYNRRIYDRCIQFLSSRLTPSAIQTAIVILSKLRPNENLGELANILWAGIKFPNKKIQRMAVDLYFHCLSHFPNSDDLAKGMISMCTFCMSNVMSQNSTGTTIITNSTTNLSTKSETYGALMVIQMFIENGFDIISEKFSEIFNTIANNLAKSHDSNFLAVLTTMCEKYPQKLKDTTLVDRFTEIISDNFWDINEKATVNCFVRISRLFSGTLGDVFGKLCYERAQTATVDDSYFNLVSVKFGDYSNEIEIIEKFRASDLTEAFTDAAYLFLKAYPQFAFRFIPFLIKKTDECLNSENFINSFLLIHKFVDAPIFPFLKYWDPIFDSLKTNSELSNEAKKYHILALLSILHNIGEENNDFNCNYYNRNKNYSININNNNNFGHVSKYEKMLDLVFLVQGDHKEVFKCLLDNIDDELLKLFMNNEPLRLIVTSFTINSSGIACNSIIKLFIRLRKLSPLSTFNTFITLLDTIPNIYTQYTSYSSRRKLIGVWDLILDGVGDNILAPYSALMYQFTLELISNRIPTPKNFNDRINYRKIVKDNIMIHILAMRCVEKLMKLQYPYNPQKIVDAVIENLTMFFDESVQIATLNTLRSVFRSFDIKEIDIVKLHQKLFNFMKVSKSEAILYSILSILGTIGPLDPLSFHMTDPPKELFPLYDKAKREQCYLDFVMRYLLNNLKTSHETSVFLNAILYIFQFDAHKSSVYLSEIVPILEQLLNNGIVADSVFHIIRSITLLVEIEIYPYATQVFNLLQPYLVITNFNLPALKALSAQVFVLKSSFSRIAVSTFSKVLDLMTNDLDFDSNLYLLQILTHLVIFCGCSQRLFFNQIKRFAVSTNLICSYALNFLSQVILHTPYDDLCLPSIRLAISLMKNPNPIKRSAKNLLSILGEKCPIYISEKEIDISKMKRKSNCCEVTSDPFPQRTPPPIRSLSVSEVFSKNNFMQFLENSWENWLLHISQNLVLCSNSPAIRACHPLMQMSTSFEHQLFPLILISVWENSSEDDRMLLSNHIATISQNSNTPIELLSIFCDAIDAMDRAGYILFSNPEAAGRIAVRCEHFFRAVRFYERVSTPHLQIINQNDNNMNNNSVNNKNNTSSLNNVNNMNNLINNINDANNLNNNVNINNIQQKQLQVQQQVIIEQQSTIEDNIKCEMIHIHSRLQRRESALGIFALTEKAHHDASILKELSIWNEARKLYSPEKSESDFIAYIHCCSKLEDWGEIFRHADRFKNMSSEESKKSVGSYFAVASTFYNMKDIDIFLPYMSKSTPRGCMWQAIVAIHMGKMKTARNFIERGMRLNSSDRAPFLSGNYEPALPSIECATFLEELKDVVDTRENPELRDRIINLWNTKSDWIKSDVEQPCTHFVVRQLLETSPTNANEQQTPKTPQSLQQQILFSHQNNFINSENFNYSVNLISNNSVINDSNKVLNNAVLNNNNDNSNDSLHNENSYGNISVNFLDVARKLKAWDVFDNSMQRFIENKYDDEKVELLRAKVRFDRRQCIDLSEILEIVNRTKNSQNSFEVYSNAVCAYASRLPNPTPNLLEMIETVILSDKFNSKVANLNQKEKNNTLVCCRRAWKHWAYGNLYCTQHYSDNKKFAVNAVKGFVELIKLNGPLLHYLWQICSLCFTFNDNPEIKTDEILSDLSASSIEKIVQQLLIQFDHPNESVRNIVMKIISKFAENHVQAIAFPLLYIEKLKKDSPSIYFNDFMNCIRKKHPIFMTEVDLVSRGMLEISILDIEMVNFVFEKLLLNNDLLMEESNKEKVIEEIQQVIPRIHKAHHGVNEALEKGREAVYLADIEENIKDKEKLDLSKLRNGMHNIFHQFSKELFSIQTIDIAEYFPELLERTPLSVAVPGFYCSDVCSSLSTTTKSYSTTTNSYSTTTTDDSTSTTMVKNSCGMSFPTIQSFSRIVKIVPSAKCPKKLRLTGSDGNIYRYLLKGKEDLTLDQRVMQWFSLSNSLLKEDKNYLGVEKNLSIASYPIIPLSPLAGMVSWAEGGETLYRLISWYHHMKRPEMLIEESKVLDEYTIPGQKQPSTYLTKFQRYEFFKMSCEVTNDDALREAIWVKSYGAESWFTQKTNFARSTGLMSIVSYIIGLGDRHPSNILLFMKNHDSSSSSSSSSSLSLSSASAGNIAHIDFSECFEKAKKRSHFPEIVPFRLTRMMVKAMGVSGVEGDFKITAQFVMNLMRRNKPALLAFLDIFTRETENGTEIFEQVRKKLNGCEFENEKEMPVEAQVDRLIEDATNEWNLSQMFIGWAPHW